MKQAWLTHFFAWQETLTWAPALRFVLLFCIASCVLICGADYLLRRLAAWRERRAIRARNWALKQQRVQLLLDAQRAREARDADEATVAKRLAVRVWRDRVQNNRESKQFHVSAAFRDMKGTQR